MKTNRFIRRNFCTVAALIPISVSAYANTESFSFSLPLADLSSTSVNDTFSLSAFDPSLGTLTGVKLILNLSTVASPQVINLSSATGTFTNTTTSFFMTLTGPDSSTAVYNAMSAVDAGTISGPAGNVITLTGSPVTSNTSSSVAAGHFSSYEGTSPLSFTLVAPGSTQFSSAGSTANPLAFGGTGSIQGTASVEYDFTTTATPEPTAWMLGMVCMSLFAVLRIRLRRSVCLS